MISRRVADPKSVQTTWDAILHAQFHNKEPELKWILNYIQEKFNCTVTFAQNIVKQVILDKLIVEIPTKDGTRKMYAPKFDSDSEEKEEEEKEEEEKEDEEKEEVKEKKEKEDDINDWYCAECHQAGLVHSCGKCHRVYHSKCMEQGKARFKDFQTVLQYNVESLRSRRAIQQTHENTDESGSEDNSNNSCVSKDTREKDDFSDEGRNMYKGSDDEEKGNGENNDKKNRDEENIDEENIDEKNNDQENTDEENNDQENNDETKDEENNDETKDEEHNDETKDEENNEETKDEENNDETKDEENNDETKDENNDKENNDVQNNNGENKDVRHIDEENNDRENNDIKNNDIKNNEAENSNKENEITLKSEETNTIETNTIQTNDPLKTLSLSTTHIDISPQDTCSPREEIVIHEGPDLIDSTDLSSNSLNLSDISSTDLNGSDPSDAIQLEEEEKSTSIQDKKREDSPKSIDIYDESICSFCNLLRLEGNGFFDVKELNYLLQFIFERIRAWLPNVITNTLSEEDRLDFVTDEDIRRRASKLFAKRTEFLDMEAKISSNRYKRIFEFLGDAETIMHNISVFHGNDSQEYGASEFMIADCVHDIKEVLTCTDCYRSSNEKINSRWFCIPCTIPHDLVWAKQKGYPYWPAKVIQRIDSNVDVRFFGGKHERSILHLNNVKDIRERIPKSRGKDSVAFGKAVQELRLHQKYLENPDPANRIRFNRECYYRMSARGVLKGDLKGGLKGDLKGGLKGDLKGDLKGVLKGGVKGDLKGEFSKGQISKGEYNRGLNTEKDHKKGGLKRGVLTKGELKKGGFQRILKSPIERQKKSSNSKRPKSLNLGSLSECKVDLSQSIVDFKQSKVNLSDRSLNLSNKKTKMAAPQTTSLGKKRRYTLSDKYEGHKRKESPPKKARGEFSTMQDLNEYDDFDDVDFKKGIFKEEGNEMDFNGEVSSSTEFTGQQEEVCYTMQKLEQPYSDAVERMRRKLEHCKDKKSLIKTAMDCMQMETERQATEHADIVKKLTEGHLVHINETKKKQWCYNCGQDAVYHCCWNTAYCSQQCQQQHWQAEHKKVCRRKRS